MKTNQSINPFHPPTDPDSIPFSSIRFERIFNPWRSIRSRGRRRRSEKVRSQKQKQRKTREGFFFELRGNPDPLPKKKNPEEQEEGGRSRKPHEPKFH